MTTRSLIPALVLCLVLAACGDDPEPAAESTTTTETVSETTETTEPGASETPVAGGSGSASDNVDTDEPSDAQEPGQEPDDGDEDDADPVEDGGVGSPAECVVGDWLSDNSLFLAGMQEFGDEPQTVTGEVTVTFGDDGTITTNYDEWEITAEVEGATVTIHRHGIDRGDYSASDAGLSINETEMGASITLSSMGAVMMEVDPEPQNLVDTPFTCGETEMWITAYDADHRLERR